MKQLTALPLIISALGLLLSNPSVAITSSQMQIRISAICNLHANISRVANPDVVYEMCINGARDSIQKSNSICEKRNRNSVRRQTHYMEWSELNTLKLLRHIAQAAMLECQYLKPTII